MARKSKDTQATAEGTTTQSEDKTSRQPKRRARRQRAKRSTRASTGRAARGPAKTGRKKAAGSRRARTSYSSGDRSNILAAAKREGLTAAQVKKRFGVTPVTYYSWRKKSGATKSRLKGRGAAAGAAVGQTVANVLNVGDAIRDELRTYIRKILPGLLASEFEDTERKGKRRSR